MIWLVAKDPSSRMEYQVCVSVAIPPAQVHSRSEGFSGPKRWSWGVSETGLKLGSEAAGGPPALSAPPLSSRGQRPSMGGFFELLTAKIPNRTCCVGQIRSSGQSIRSTRLGLTGDCFTTGFYERSHSSETAAGLIAHQRSELYTIAIRESKSTDWCIIVSNFSKLEYRAKRVCEGGQEKIVILLRSAFQGTEQTDDQQPF